MRVFLKRMMKEIGRRLHIDVIFYTRLFSWISLSYASVVLRGLATSFLLARRLPPEVFGQFRYVIAWFSLAGIFSMSGMQAGMITGLSQGQSIVVKKVIRRMLVFLPLGSVLLLIGGGMRWYQGEYLVAYGFFISALAFPLQMLCGLYGPILTGMGNVRRLVVANTLLNTLYACIFAAALSVSQHFLFLVAVYFFVDILAKGSLTLREIKRLPITGTDHEADRHVGLGTHLSAINVFQVIVFQLDQLVIQRFGGYTRLAEYNIALLLPDQIKDFVNSVSGIMLGRLSKYESTAKTLFASRRHFWTATGVGASIFLGYALLAPWVMPWLFPAYAEQVWLSVVYASSLMFVIPTIMGTNFLQAHHQTRLLWRLYTLNSVVQFITNVALTPFFGAWGAIAARVFTRFVTLPVSYPQLREKQDEFK